MSDGANYPWPAQEEIAALKRDLEHMTERRKRAQRHGDKLKAEVERLKVRRDEWALRCGKAEAEARRLSLENGRLTYLLGSLSIWAEGLPKRAGEAVARARDEWNDDHKRGET